MRVLSFVLATALVAVALPSGGRAAEPAAAGNHAHATARGVQSLDVYASGDALHLLVAEIREGDPRAALFHRRSEDGGETWSQPVQVDAGLSAAHSPHRGMDPQIAAAGNQLIAVWMTKGTGLFDSGPMATALSSDGGKTWRAGPNPADDNSTTGHGFIDVGANIAGTFHLTWLDSRDGKQGLRYARSTDGGKAWTQNQTVKAATCECCSNALAINADGSVAILFRDGGPRDMSVARSRDGGSKWLSPMRAGDFGWQFNGCPHVGGGLAFARDALHAVVWTGMDAHAGVYHLKSLDFGTTWSQTRRLGGSTASHPDITVAADQRIVVVWDEDTNGHSGIWSAVSADGGLSWDKPVSLSKAEANATHPRVVAGLTGFRVIWSESRPDRTMAVGTAMLP